MFKKLLEIKESRMLLDISLWSGDLVNMKESIIQTEEFADVYHLDVADAHFVPSLLFFPDFINSINKHTEKPLHCHLMMEDPYAHLDEFIDVGADIITVHIELGHEKVSQIINYLKSKHILVGLSIRVETDVKELERYIQDIDFILLMGTKIGIKGVDMYEKTPERVRSIKKTLIAQGFDQKIILSVDGGIRAHTVPELRKNGADMITPGSIVFGSNDMAKTVTWLYNLPSEV